MKLAFGSCATVICSTGGNDAADADDEHDAAVARGGARTTPSGDVDEAVGRACAQAVSSMTTARTGRPWRQTTRAVAPPAQHDTK